ncbi:hypothetical protein BD414DRAFT_22215 [Trametes punicea]|nr:hypothetical protein BD414DRAFT_22215 [Trametes punicea]
MRASSRISPWSRSPLMSLASQHRSSIWAYWHPGHIHPVLRGSPYSAIRMLPAPSCFVSIVTAIGTRTRVGATRPCLSRIGSSALFLTHSAVYQHSRTWTVYFLAVRYRPPAISSCTDIFYRYIHVPHPNALFTPPLIIISSSIPDLPGFFHVTSVLLLLQFIPPETHKNMQKTSEKPHIYRIPPFSHFLPTPSHRSHFVVPFTNGRPLLVESACGLLARCAPSL